MRLSELTTLRVGGEAREYVEATTKQELVDAALAAWSTGDDWLVVGGGSNLLVADAGVDGTVIHVATRGIEQLDDASDAVLLRVQAGESWEALVALAVANSWAGIEALSGIPGSCGAAPIQNIGAYGQELSSHLEAIEFLDYLSGEVLRLTASELHFGYRTSALKQGLLGVVLSIDLRLIPTVTGLGEPIAYPQLAAALGVELGERVSLGAVRDAVLALRSSKGMVLDASDPDSVSAGSFFTNPIVSDGFAQSLPSEVPRWPVSPADSETLILDLDTFDPSSIDGRTLDREDRRVKLSAAWLIEHSGVARGFRLPGSRAAISSKHTLALVNTGGATSADLSELARYVQTRVLGAFGVILQPEPVLVNVQL